MTVWIDGDSCPKSVRDMVGKACLREQVPLKCVANREIPFDVLLKVEMLVVPTHEGAADDLIVESCSLGDLVLTRDIPLAARLVEKKIRVINDRGVAYTQENVRERLSIRNFMADLNAMGLKPESTAVYSAKDKNNFAKVFDKEFMALVRAQNREI